MTRILLCAPVKQERHVFKEYLESLDRLQTDGIELTRCFYLHESEELRDMLKPSDVVLLNNTAAEYRVDGDTHEWTGQCLSEVARMKNEMLQIFLDNDFDYFFLVDSDLILHPTTLQVLLDRKKDIVSEVFWTEWQKGSGEFGPNCWDMDFCQLNPNRYKIPGLHACGGTGACILISRAVIEAGINYAPIPNVSFTRWEDRAFCVRAAVNGFPIFIDTTRPARHLYRQSDYEKYMKKKEARRNEGKS